MKISTHLKIGAGTAAVVTGTLLAASTADLRPGEVRLQQSPGIELPGVADRDLRESILTDENWAEHQVVPNRVFVKFRADLARLDLDGTLE